MVNPFCYIVACVTMLEYLFHSLTKHFSRTDFFSEPCELAKHKCSYLSHNNRSFIPFSLIYPDAWGPSRFYSRSCYRWFVTFTDCHSRYTWVYLLHHKNECVWIPQNLSPVQTQFHATFKILQNTNGHEYTDLIIFSRFWESV